MALVIAHTASIQFSIAQAWLKWRSFPQFKWFGRLNIIMVINEKCLIRFAFPLSEDNGCTCSFHNLDFKAARLEHFTHKRRAFLQSQVLRADAGLGDETRKLIEAFIEILFEVCIQLAVFRHYDLLISGSLKSM